MKPKSNKKVPISINAVPVAVVDRFCVLDTASKALEADKTTQRILLLSLIPEALKAQAQCSYLLPGSVEDILVTAQPEMRSLTDSPDIDVVQTLWKWLGKKKFMELANFSIEDLRGSLTDEQFNVITVVKPTVRRCLVKPKTVTLEVTSNG